MVEPRHSARRPGRAAARRRAADALEMLEPRVLLTAPTATLTADDVTAAGGQYHAFIVDYADDTGIDRFSVDDGDARVTGPMGFVQQAKLITRQPTPDGTGFRAVYRIAAPLGTWDAADNGVYTIRLLDNQVLDHAGNAVPGGELGQFTVQADSFDISDRVPADLGVVDGVRLVPNLNTLEGVADGFIFKMAGTGQRGDYVRIDYVEGEGFLKPLLFRLTDQTLVQEIKRDREGEKRGDVLTKFYGLAGLPPGTYSLTIDNLLVDCDHEGRDCDLFTFRNPNYVLSIRAGRVQPVDLVPTVTTAALPPVIVPGDRVRASVRVTNTGTGYAAGSVNVSFYLSQDAVLDGGDTLIGVSGSRPLRLVPGASRQWRPVVDLPGAANVQSGEYFLITHIDSGDLIPESDEANNIVVSPQTVRVERSFGQLEGRRNTRYRLQDADGTRVTISISGSGTGEVIGEGDDAVIIVRGTTERSTLRISTVGGDRRWTVRDIIVGDHDDDEDRTSLRAISARGVDVLGNVTVTGTIGLINVNGMRGGEVTIGPGDDARDAVVMRLGDVADVSVRSQTPVRALVVNDWGEMDGVADVLAATSVGVMNVRGDLSGVAIELAQPVQANARVRALGMLSVRGVISDVLVRSAGHIGSIVAGAMIDTAIYAGIDPAATGLPDTVDAVASTAMIGSVVARGTRDEPYAFVRSIIAAHEVQRVTLRLVDIDAAEPFGIAGRAIGSVLARTDADVIRLRRVDDFNAFDPVGMFDVRALR